MEIVEVVRGNNSSVCLIELPLCCYREQVPMKLRECLLAGFSRPGWGSGKSTYLTYLRPSSPTTENYRLKCHFSFASTNFPSGCNASIILPIYLKHWLT